VLDLGLVSFAQYLVQALKYEMPSLNTQELIELVMQAFAEFDSHKLNHVFLTLLFGCFNEIISSKGGNYYSIPHMGKARLERLGLLPLSIEGNALRRMQV
jgi:hypothetical protein